MRKFRHITPRYLVAKARLYLYNQRNPDDPWIASDAIEVLNTLLKKSDIRAEFGSGRSTIWLAKRVGHLYSFEDNKEWWDKVSARINEEGIFASTTYKLCIDDEGYMSSLSLIKFKELDFCFIDGGDRGRLALMAIEKIKDGCLLIVDNVNWYLPSNTRSPGSVRHESEMKDPVWNEFYKKISNKRYIWTSNGVADTAIWMF
jgi:predicted O-methyltransferase YrrM